MKVFYIVNDLGYFRQHRENIAIALAAEGHEVIVAAGESNAVSVEDWPPSMTLVPLDLDRQHFNLFSDLRFIFSIRSLMKEHRPDLVHALTIKPVLYGSMAVLMSGVRSGVVWTFPGLGKIFENPGQFIPALRRRLVTSVLGWLARKLNPQATFENYVDPRVLTLHEILHEDQCSVLSGAGIPESFLEAAENFTRGRSGNVSKGKIRVGMATRLLADKGVDTFLDAASAITAHGFPMEFQLAGVHDPGNPGSISMDAVREAEERGEIVFHGALNSAQMPEFLASLDVFCLPTRLREGFPRSLIEAALAGCALIATDQQSIRQIVVPDKTGWLLPGGDRGELCERLEFVAGKPEEVHRAGAEAREFALSMPIADHDIVRAFGEVYRAALVR